MKVIFVTTSDKPLKEFQQDIKRFPTLFVKLGHTQFKHFKDKLSGLVEISKGNVTKTPFLFSLIWLAFRCNCATEN